MPGFFSIIVDKSVLQSLSPREAEWLFHHYRVNVPPVLFAEVLGDLRKTKNLTTTSGVRDAQALAKKVDGSGVDLHMDTQRLVTQELLGYEITMDGRPCVENAEMIRMPDGSLGMHIDQTPLQRVLGKWQAGDFNGMELAFSQQWRNHLDGIDLEGALRSAKGWRNKSIDTPAKVAQTVDAFLFRENSNHANLTNWLQVLKVPEPSQRKVIDRWRRAGRPPVIRLFPLTASLARLRLFFYLAVVHGVVTTRSSNEIDFQYFEYLPFTRVFSSSDKLHSDMFPIFANSYNYFVPGPDLKQALREMADFYEAMPLEEKSEGSYSYAEYPPVHMNNAVTKSFDRYYPRWRDGANQPKPPRDKSKDAEILAKIREFQKAVDAQKRR